MLLKLERWINRLSEILGRIAGLLLLLLVLNVFYDVVARYIFNSVSIGMQELEWHLYATMFLLGVPYAITRDGHVRVDIIYERLSLKRKALIDLVGSITLLLPFALMVSWCGIDFTWQAYDIGEGSGDPGGLPYRWVIKSMIPFAFLAIVIAATGTILKSINILRSPGAD